MCSERILKLSIATKIQNKKIMDTQKNTFMIIDDCPYRFRCFWINQLNLALLNRITITRKCTLKSSAFYKNPLIERSRCENLIELTSLSVPKIDIFPFVRCSYFHWIRSFLYATQYVKWLKSRLLLYFAFSAAKRFLCAIFSVTVCKCHLLSE